MVGIRIGVLHDFPIGDEGRSFEDFARRGMRHVTDGDRLSEDIEFVHAVGLGLPMPGGTAHAVEDAFAHLLDEGVVAILGPAVSDDTLVAQPLADRARIPCINYTGSDETRSEYMFQFQIGSLEDEPSFLADNLARRGLRRVALVRDRSYVGRRMADFFEEACAVEGISLVARQEADAVVSLGMWDPAIALAAEGVDVPVVANSALIYGHLDRDAARAWDGWAYPDTISDENPLYLSLGRDVGPGTAGRYDMGRLLAEGLARARVLTGPGVMDGLERVKSLPAASGEPGTLMGFGRCDRGALKGRYLVIRTWRAGRSVVWTDAAAAEPPAAPAPRRRVRGRRAAGS